MLTNTGEQPATLEVTMEHEVIVEGFVLQVEVTHCINEPPSPGNSNSDWDAQGDRQIEFKIHSAICYDESGVRMDLERHLLYLLARQYGSQIESALWIEIDALKRRQRWAA
ncbi:hypothetical protein [Pseudomonas sp. ADAK13]|uniref:hypothetical protein n=1 Tax=Pseudomonas sp. ADAK13 TaxID=2730847 RepID=UPI001F291CB0|nr:hypothetical protein [Pseudomonas sp. ADAK13]